MAIASVTLSGETTGFPRASVGSGHSLTCRIILAQPALEMFAQVLERQEGVTDATFRPIEKEAPLGGHDDVPGTAITVPERVGQLELMKQRAGFLQPLAKQGETCGCERLGRLLPLLRGHQIGHSGEERIHQFDEALGAASPCNRLR